jgi:L-ribulose-5-phosphate 3-epimerase
VLQNRREFLATAGAGLAAAAPANDISLAAWSLNRSFFVGRRWKNLDLPKICREEFGINGLEFVNQFFDNPMLDSLRQLKRAGSDYGVRFVLIMCDGEGDMAAVDRNERLLAARAHRKWIDIAHFLGCHAIRCNLGGPRENWKADGDLVARAAESFRDLLDYAKGSGLNVLIENHGRASSDPDVLVALMKTVNDPHFGTLPDFGNVNPGDDHAEVLRRLLPYAKGMSVKAAWNADGTHTRWDLDKLLRIARDAGYRGYWGIESSFGRTRGEQAQLPADQIWEQEKRGVLLTKQAIERVVFERS